MIMMNMAWNSRLRAYPFVIQKYILRIADIMRMAHTSMENEPTDCYFLMSCHCEQQPITGATATATSKIHIPTYQYVIIISQSILYLTWLLSQHMRKTVKINRLSDQHQDNYGSPYKRSPNKYNNTQKQDGLQNLISIFNALDLSDIRELNIKRLRQSLQECSKIAQFLNRLIRIVIQVKDRQQINCQYINTKMEKQIKSMRTKIDKQDQTIFTLKSCYEESKQHYQSIINTNQVQIREIQMQNKQLRQKIKQLEIQKDKNERTSMQELLFNLKRESNNYNNHQQQRNRTIYLNRSRSMNQSEKQKVGQGQSNKNMIKDLEYSFDTPVQSGRKRKDYSSLGQSEQDLLVQINELRDNEKKLELKLKQREHVIHQLLQLSGMKD